ncbi:MAG TPA: phosphoribosylaminoimidazolesuccinocarboxamide synthase [Alphaproteobacteria bacterium]|nr:phosphoribosylaminoimidazolesuccinocarboxamide synthase [Alphaproteobacteria bacterium]
MGIWNATRAKRPGVYNGSVFAVRIRPDGTAVMADSGWMSAGDKAKYRFVAGLAPVRTAHNDHVMQHLKRYDMPLAYRQRMNATTFVCDACDMTKLELVVRGRTLEGYAKLFGPETAGKYHVEPIEQAYYKGALDMRDPAKPVWADTHDIKHGEGETPAGVYTDPLIIVVDGMWHVHAAGQPFDAVKPLHVCAPLVGQAEWKEAWALARRAFGLLRAGIEQVGNRPSALKRRTGIRSLELADFKVEVGRRKSDGKLVIADVLNLDSMRIIVDGNWQDPMAYLSKDPYRKAPPNVLDNPAKLAELVLNTYMLGRDVLAELKNLP